MKTFLLACLLGVTGLAFGLISFGQIDGQKIRFEKSTLEKVDSFDEAWPVARAQPDAVYVSGGVGFLVGCLAGLVLWLIRRGRKAPASGAAADSVSRHEVVPAKPPRKLPESDLERLEAERPFICKLLGFLTFGIYKFYAVPQGKALVVTAVGKYRKACEPGLGSILSFWGLYQHPYKSMPLVQWKEYAAPYENETVTASDGVKCRLDVMICYRVADPGKALFEVDNYERAIENMVRTVLRSECAKQPAQTLVASREQMAGVLRGTLEKNVVPWGIMVRLLEITNIEAQEPQESVRFGPIGSR
jgi:hypothetical protein